MNFNSNIDRLFAFLIYFSTLTIDVKSDSKRALSFDRKNGVLIDIEAEIENGEKKIQHELAVACPAEFPSEKRFNSEHSFGKNSLFVRSTYEGTASPSPVSQDICSAEYKLSIIYNRHDGEFELGYEVYYKLEEYGPFKHYSYANFDTIANAYSENSKKRKNRFSKLKLELMDADGKIAKEIKLGFVWISVIRFKFNNSEKTTTGVIYILSKYKEMGAHCKDYSLGEEIYNKENIDLLYNKQIDTFNNVAIPETDKGCETKNNCLIKYSLVPAEEFHFRSPEPMSISCSNLTTVPIWKRAIHGALQKLDTFLYALAKIVPGTITVLSGVHGQLEMKNLRQETTKIFLGDKNKVPVPKIVYKIVMYNFIKIQLRATEDSDGDLDWIRHKIAYKRASVIVFHNDPEFDVKDALCEAKNCERLGWGEILNGATSQSKSPLNNLQVYCCPANKKILPILGIKYESIFSEELNLRRLPIFDEATDISGKTNIEQRVIKKMKNLLRERPDMEDVAQNDKV